MLTRSLLIITVLLVTVGFSACSTGTKSGYSAVSHHTETEIPLDSARN